MSSNHTPKKSRLRLQQQREASTAATASALVVFTSATDNENQQEQEQQKELHNNLKSNEKEKQRHPQAQDRPQPTQTQPQQQVQAPPKPFFKISATRIFKDVQRICCCKAKKEDADATFLMPTPPPSPIVPILAPAAAIPLTVKQESEKKIIRNTASSLESTEVNVKKRKKKPRPVIKGRPPAPMSIAQMKQPSKASTCTKLLYKCHDEEEEGQDVPRFVMEDFVTCALVQLNLIETLDQLRQDKEEELQQYLQIVTRNTSRSVMELFIDHALVELYGPNFHKFERRDSDSTFSASTHSMQFYLDDDELKAHDKNFDQRVVDTTPDTAPAAKFSIRQKRSHSLSSCSTLYTSKSSSTPSPGEKSAHSNPQDCASNKFSKLKCSSSASNDSIFELETQMSRSAWMKRYRTRLISSSTDHEKFIFDKNAYR